MNKLTKNRSDSVLLFITEHATHVDFLLGLFFNRFFLSGGGRGSTTSSGGSSGSTGRADFSEALSNDFMEALSLELGSKVIDLLLIGSNAGLLEESSDLIGFGNGSSSKDEQSVGSNVFHFRFL